MDPLILAEEIKKSYAINLIGTDQEAMKKLLGRFGDPNQPLTEKLGELVKMRGPFLQALGIPRWGEHSWSNFANQVQGEFAPIGLETEIIETFRELGFQRLYEFQEQGIKSVLDDQHTLVVAGTGRGKTESWLLPLFHYIIARKRDKIIDDTPKHGTKALLIYPTKALAQDQLKRLLNYLFRLNQKLEPSARISVGIFDGDTPSRNDPDVRSYLYHAFQYFRCPIYDASQSKCQSCGQHLLVPAPDLTTAPYVLALPRPECRHLASLDFVRLTRDDIRQQQPDIVLTNPDMLNLRLLNINGVDERRFLIEQPKFIVLDEVHIYTELLGSFTSFIMKRLRQERAILRNQPLVADRLRFIAASATVANEQDLFSRLCNLPATTMRVVREANITLQSQPITLIPAPLTETRLDDTALNDAILALNRGDQPPSPYNSLLDMFSVSKKLLPSSESGEEIVLEAAAKQMYEQLTQGVDENPTLNLLRSLHHTLIERPMTPPELQTHLREIFPDESDITLEDLTHNFITLAVFSGLLESRAHLFAWPIDGYYTCLDCGRVYDTPVANCMHCGGQHIHKLALCTECGEEAVESWFCPHCRTIYPLSATIDGENVYYQGRPCQCTGTPLPTLRVIWKPYYRCARCGDIQRLSPADFDGLAPRPCAQKCGGHLQPIIDLPWVCNAGHPHFEVSPPATCHCGSRIFAMAGLFDIDSGLHCNTCKGDFLEGMPHPEDHHTTPGGDFREYKLLDHNYRIRRPNEFQDAVPCHHFRSRYLKIGNGARYDVLMRSPANAAVTSAQYALRNIVGNASDDELRQQVRQAKILSFSDSYSDMEQLAQDFDDPERNTFIDQAIVTILAQGECTLKDLTIGVLEQLKLYGELLQQGTTESRRGLNWVKHFGDANVVWGEVERRFLSGNYNYQMSYSPWLVREAIANVRLSTTISDEERPIIEALVEFNQKKRETLQKELQDKVANYGRVLEELETRGLVQSRRAGRAELLFLNPEYLVCSLVDDRHPMPSDELRGYLRGLSTLEVEIGRRKARARFNIDYRQRAQLEHPHFSRVAYRIAYARPLLLRSEVYKGSIKKEKRREIEFEFKEGAEIHFLSSGPAMEVGIDIGDLDLLLLFGTPPNINAYLQRIGRAGRRSKQSLILSVSKRNPIDFYYYRRPLELIKSNPQPVPLNEHNEEVMKVSLTWALLDFIAVNFWVPWQKIDSPDGTSYSDGQNFQALATDQADLPPDIRPLIWLIYVAKNADLDFGDPLEALAIIVHDRRDQAFAYLRQLLSYRRCDHCGTYIHDDAATTCPVDGCSGKPIVQSTRYNSLLEAVLNEFPVRMIGFLLDFRDELWTQRKQANRVADDLQDEIMRNRRMPQEQKRELTAKAERQTARVRAIDDLLQRLERMSFADAQKYSPQSRYAYSIRTVEETVEVIEYEERNGKIQANLGPSRGLAMAMKEYHPYAVILSGRQKTFTRAVHFDDYRTEQLKERLAEAEVPFEPLACSACGRIYPDGVTCVCGKPLQRMALKVLRSAETQSLQLRLSADPEEPDRQLYPRDVFRLGGSENEVKRTYANLNSQVVAFTPERCFTLLDGHNHPIGMLDFGQIEVVTFSDSCTVIHENGFRQPWPQVFEICGESDCHGVIIQSRDKKVCSLDPVGHQHSPRQIVRLAQLFTTEGLRLRLPDEPPAVTHTLAHGLRMGLEKIGGVLVRNIHELVEANTGTIYIYDSLPGGSGVTRLLVQPEGDHYRNFAEAITTMHTVATDCQCEDGCPHCLYQYGCDTWNTPASLTRHGLHSLLSSGLQLQPISAVPGDGNAEMRIMAWSPAEDYLRQNAWRDAGRLELRLRQLIQARYVTAFGEDWPSTYLPEKKLSQVQEIQQREQKQHGASQPLIEYTYLQDLLELMTRQWDLFANLFGAHKKAKGQLAEQIQAIVKVRNPLAHNRPVPESDLNLAREYCREITQQLS